ncbi:hypothetical protein [Larkinella arboricola]
MAEYLSVQELKRKAGGAAKLLSVMDEPVHNRTIRCPKSYSGFLKPT